MFKKAIIYVPGLNDRKLLNSNLVKLLPLFWRRYGFEVYPIQPSWNNGKEFISKLKLITNKIDELHSKGFKIYLFGQSAGGAAVLNAFVERKGKVEKVVNICGRLKKGNKVFPSLDLVAKGNPAFKESVLLFENQNEKKLTGQDRKKILTIKPIFDEIVPQSTVNLEGTTNIMIPIVGHSLGGIFGLTIFGYKIRKFLAT